jgi:plastocyanin
MRRNTWGVVFLGGAVALSAWLPGGGATVGVRADDGDQKKILIRDDCDPADPAWAPSGGCALEDGDVDNAEFLAESNLTSGPLAASVIGHQAWRNDPSYLKVEEGKAVKVRNKGGRVHTFTEVANFGGGRVGVLNKGLAPAPECVPPTATSVDLAPGARAKVSGLAVGNHRFQCCIHPWMRALVKVQPKGDHDDEDDHHDHDDDEHGH